MKKLFLIAVIAVMALGASAQNWYLGGSVGYTHTKVDDEKTDNIVIAPEVGYNVSETIALGASLGVDWVKDSYTNFAIAPYARYTFFRSENNLVNLFVDGGFSIGISKPKGGDTTTIWGIGFKPGLAVNLTDRFSLVAHAGFLGYEDYKEAGKMAGFGIDASKISFGFFYNF